LRLTLVIPMDVAVGLVDAQTHWDDHRCEAAAEVMAEVNDRMVTAIERVLNDTD
jgi:hypothetical protein